MTATGEGLVFVALEHSVRALADHPRVSELIVALPLESAPLVAGGATVRTIRGPLARASGCLSCTQCGWGRCG